MTVAPAIDSLAARVEAELHEILGARQMPLYDMMSYHLGWADARGESRPQAQRERSHGAACLAACYAAGGDMEVALPAAASVELIEGFSQVHDDVQGGNPSRDNQDAVWWVWGPAQAINAGDGMHALARLAMFRLQERGVSAETTFRAVQMLDEASLELCEGRFQDLEAQERIDLSVEAYLEMASSKTGALYSCAMKLGALVASAGPAVIDAFGSCGVNIGIAAQIRQDLMQLWGDAQGNGQPSSEVLNKKKLLPVVYAVEKANLNEKRRLGDIYFKRVLEKDDVVAVREILEGLGAKAHCEQMVAGYQRNAEEALEGSGVSAEGLAMVKGLIARLLPA